MKISPLDVVLVALFLSVAIVGGYLKILGTELVAAIVTGCLAFLAMRIKLLGGKDETKTNPPAEEGAPDKAMEGHHSHRITVGENGSMKVEDMASTPDEHKIVEPPK